MRLFRLFIVVLLSATIPVQGVAGPTAVKVPCPMHANVHHAATAMPATDAANANADHVTDSKAHDCCKDTACTKTGKTCKSCQNCKIGSYAQMTSQVDLTFAKPADRQSPRHHSSFVALTLASIWRPPTLL